MIRVRLVEEYQNWYWNSATGFTIRKDNREGIMMNEDDNQVRLALDQGILEIVTDETLKELREQKEEDKPKIITDIPTKETIKEVVTEENTKNMEKLKKGE